MQPYGGHYPPAGPRRMSATRRNLLVLGGAAIPGLFGFALLVIGYLLPVPAFLITIGWLLLVLGFFAFVVAAIVVLVLTLSRTT